MDYSTVVTSALLSVVLSLFAASRVAMRQEQGRDRHLAWNELHRLVQPRWRAARSVELGLSERTQQVGVDGDDLVFASRCLAVCQSLTWWRRRLIRRRLCILVGRMWIDQFEVRPISDDSLNSFRAPILSAQHLERENPRYKESDRRGLYFSALSGDAEPGEPRRLRRQLGLLMRGF